MNKLTKQVAVFQIIMTLIIAMIFASVLTDIENLQNENITLKNDLNDAHAKIKMLEVIDDKLYAHVDTLGDNDLMLQSWIEEINCMLYDCNKEWSGQYENY